MILTPHVVRRFELGFCKFACEFMSIRANLQIALTIHDLASWTCCEKTTGTTKAPPEGEADAVSRRNPTA